MVINGVVEEIIYSNAETGYTVVDISSEGTLITAVGTFPPVAIGENLTLHGEFVINNRYGEQFAVSKVETALPVSREGIIRYLSSGLFKGIGPVTALRIVEVFGTDALVVMSTDPLKLKQVKGISKKRAIEIAESFNSMRAMQDTILFLQSYDISLGLCIKIYRCYEERTADVLKTNPYKLVDDIDGVGFATADKIAKNMGIEKDSEFRVRAGISYLLQDSAVRGGHTYLPRQDLEKSLYTLLGLDQEQIDVESALMALEFDGIVKCFTHEDVQVVMSSKLFAIEHSIATKLVRLIREYDQVHVDIDTDISEFERINSLNLHPTQRDAVKNAVNSGVFVLTGGPGTGKTTIIKCILYILKNQNKQISLCAPTGRASKRMSEATGEDAKTIHRLLCLEHSDGLNSFRYNESNPLTADVIIVDEASMADVYVFNALVKAIKRGGRLIIVGDKDQLPSVGAGNVLRDIIASSLVSVTMLEHIYRQSENSHIVSNAHLINHGEMPRLDLKSDDFFFTKQKGQEDILSTVRDLVCKRLPSYMQVSPRDIQVLTAMKKGVSGVNNINKVLQLHLNPNPKGVLYGETEYKVGDKVMQTANDYNLEWYRYDEDGTKSMGQGIFNGDIGIVDSIDIPTQSITVLFEDGRYCTYQGDLSDLKLAYCISIHKSQGCEFDVVVIALTPGSPQILTRNLIYTAVTRAKKMVVIVGDDGVLARMVRNDYTATRYSMLKDMMLTEYRKYGELYV